MDFQYNLQNINMWLRDLQKRNISFTTKLDLVGNCFLSSITPSLWLRLLIRNIRGSLVRQCDGSRLVLWWVWCWESKGLLFLGRGVVVLVLRRIWLGLYGREKVCQHMGKSVSALFHNLRPLVQDEVGFSPGNGSLLCKAETTVLASS